MQRCMSIPRRLAASGFGRLLFLTARLERILWPLCLPSVNLAFRRSDRSPIFFAEYGIHLLTRLRQLSFGFRVEVSNSGLAQNLVDKAQLFAGRQQIILRSLR